MGRKPRPETYGPSDPEISRPSDSQTLRPLDRRIDMATKIIVSYDGTANEDDAIAYGSLLAGAGAEIHLGYVRHSQEPVEDRGGPGAAGARRRAVRRSARRRPRRDQPLHPRRLGRPGRADRRPGDRVLLGLPHRPRARRRSATPPSACSKAVRVAVAHRSGRPRRGQLPAACGGSSPSARRAPTPAPRQPLRRSRARSAARSCPWPTTRPICW